MVRIRYLNNAAEQDQRSIKPRVGPMLGFESFAPACSAIAGIDGLCHAAHFATDPAGRPVMDLPRNGPWTLGHLGRDPVAKMNERARLGPSLGPYQKIGSATGNRGA